MNKWKVKYYMKDGDLMTGFYEGPETDPAQVVDVLFHSSVSNFTPVISTDAIPDGGLFVRKSEVVSCVILKQ